MNCSKSDADKRGFSALKWLPAPLPNSCADGGRAGFCIAYWWTSGRRSLSYFILNHGAAKGNRRCTRINANAEGRRDANKDFFANIDWTEGGETTENTEKHRGFWLVPRPLCTSTSSVIFISYPGYFPADTGKIIPSPRASSTTNRWKEGGVVCCIANPVIQHGRLSLFPNPVQKKGGRGLHSILADIRPPGLIIF